MSSAFRRRSAAPLAAVGLVAVLLAACEPVFAPPGGPPVYVGVSAGAIHTCAVTRSGSIYCWGAGRRGQLGTGETRVSFVPVRVDGSGVEFTSVSAGGHHTCALDAAGRAWCWGANDSGQLGTGTTVDALEPARVAGDHRFRAISAGFEHTCAITTGNRAYCWGSNELAQLGTGTAQSALEPVPVAGGLRVRAISAGFGHTCAVTTAHQLYCWGRNGVGQLGTGTTRAAPEPTRVQSDLEFRAVAAGFTHTCALTTDSRAYCWGGSAHGQVGIPSRTRPGRALATEPIPIFQHDRRRYIDISAGRYYTCAIARGGTAWCWGWGLHGQTGFRRNPNAVTPKPVDTTVPVRFTSVTASAGTHTCALTNTNNVFCWGTGQFGQLGTGSVTRSFVPIRVFLRPD